MDNTRLILIIALVGILFLIYSAWVEDYGPVAQVATAPSSTTSVMTSSPDAPPMTTAVASPLATDELTVNTVKQQLIQVETDLFKIEISPYGGTISNIWLLDYAQKADAPTTKFQLLKSEVPNMFIVQSGLYGAVDKQLPTHNSLFSTAKNRYQLTEGENALTVELYWDNDSGIQVIKRYRFERGQYVVTMTQEVINRTEKPLVVRAYDQLQRSELHDVDQSRFVSTYTGSVYYGPEQKYKKKSFDEMKEQTLNVVITDGWIAMIQHYFMAAWIPPTGQPQTFYTKVINTDGNDRYIIGKYTETIEVSPIANYQFTNRLFVGPKLQDTLAQVAPGLGLAVDYGWLTIIAEPIFWLLEKLYYLFGNWGWAIIVLTILIKLAFYKLSETSYKSMANMRKLTPRMKAIKDRYGDDKERLNQALMELYKKEKINPLNGCLPIFVQIPVFIALYWVLLESVELRHAPFVLWLDNLTSPDPYYILPLIMGISMFVQQKLNPPPPDPMQEKIMLTLPVVFTIFFAFFPSGLVLYWTVNNLLSIAQQWYITDSIEKGVAKH
ncbi:membrane protein insertase YidC [Thiospirillum jenense]|uniref:Membrane protein insertase YidC n=1 Tax=Thiospirillum jenense TaxID=1653858 RepID=A0A839HK17_9GAMM|nr:membrane protein insertase YidC [Thiospirillum jenense]MBB1127037.1 membrane protein insertase YidC [Thiospirillum jenense]